MFFKDVNLLMITLSIVKKKCICMAFVTAYENFNSCC